MTCPKCGGLLVEELYLDEEAKLEEWKCINCGYRWTADRPVGRFRCR